VHPVGIRVGPRLEHPGHDDPVEPLADALQRLDRRPEVAHLLAELDRVAFERRELAQPRQEDLHRVTVKTASGSGRRW
jgi:hypothetical protein